MIHYGIRQNKSAVLRVQASGLHAGARAIVQVTTGATPEGFFQCPSAAAHFCSSKFRQIEVMDTGRGSVLAGDDYGVVISGGLPGIKVPSFVRFEALLEVYKDYMRLTPTDGAMLAVHIPDSLNYSIPWGRKGGAREVARYCGFNRANQMMNVLGKVVI